MTLVAALSVTVLSVAVLAVPKKIVMVPFFIGICFIPMSERVVIAGADFTTIRLLVFWGFLRVLIRKDVSIQSIGKNPVDILIVSWVIIGSISYIIQQPGKAAIILKTGFVWNVLGLYFLFRWYVDDKESFDIVFKTIAIICIVLSVAMAFEHINGRNWFSIFGGVEPVSWMRKGRYRAQGPFRHAITAGTFGATQLPILFFLYLNLKKNIYLIGSLAAVGIVIFCSSSGPFLTFGCALIGIGMWKYREKIPLVRNVILLTILTYTALKMHKPIWYIFAKMGYLLGGTGEHRAWVIDAALKYFNEWWLIGTGYTAHWLPFTLPNDPNNIDITNQFLAVGVSTGLLSMILFILMQKKTFDIFKILRYSSDNSQPYSPMLIHALGVSMAAHIVTFFSVVYFDQMMSFYYLLIAIVASLYEMYLKTTEQGMVSNV